MKEKYRIHQVISAAPGTRVMQRIDTEGGTAIWEAVPVVLFGLLEDLTDGGDRFVVPLMQWHGGLFNHTMDESMYGEVLAPGEEPGELHLMQGTR